LTKGLRETGIVCSDTKKISVLNKLPQVAEEEAV